MDNLLEYQNSNEDSAKRFAQYQLQLCVIYTILINKTLILKRCKFIKLTQYCLVWNAPHKRHAAVLNHFGDQLLSKPQIREETPAPPSASQLLHPALFLTDYS